jgi:hypothetical protein
MSTITGPNTNETGLAFAFDTGDRGSSFLGEPTVNLAADLGLTDLGAGLTYLGIENGWKKYSMAGTWSGGGYPYSMALNAVSFTGGRLHTSKATLKTNVENKFNYFATSGISYVNEPMSASGTLSSTLNADDSRTVDRVNFAYTNTTGQLGYLFTNPINGITFNPATDFVWLKDFQIEQKSYATPFVNGTRTSTQSLIDLTSNNLINTSGVSFDSTGNITFDGTDDFLTLSSDVTFKTTGGWTVESVVYYNSVAGGYNNTTSPANFIGSEGTDYNSWYWSVLENRLALWNISPGYWRYGSTTLQPNRFYHVTLVSSANGYSYRFYLNGVAEGGDHVSQVWNPDYSGLKVRYIGKGNNANPRLVNGKIPITKIYNRPLLDSEIYNNFLGYKTRFNM